MAHQPRSNSRRKGSSGSPITRLFRNRNLMSLIPGLGIPAALTYAYTTTLNFAPLWVWLVVLNLTLLGLMGKDKLAAKRGWGRTPEFTLLLLTFLGATPGILVARPLFQHKTTKESFRYALFGTIAVQGLCAWYFWPQLHTLM